MSSASSIEWTDTTWNPVVGCTKISQGCKHCYAETMAARHVLMSAAQGRRSPYLPVVDAERRRWNGRAVTLPERLAEPLSWEKPRRVFVNSMSDLFHEDVPFEFIGAVFGVMAATPRHSYQVLTKRPARMLEFFAWHEQKRKVYTYPTTELAEGYLCGEDDASSPAYKALNSAWVRGDWPLPNVWLGVSVEDQATADERIPPLLKAPAAVCFISAEPLLGPVALLPRWVDRRAAEALGVGALDWVIAGGESGLGARECRTSWVGDIVDACRSAAVPVFVKQLGARPVWSRPVGFDAGHDPRLSAWGGLKDRKGGDINEWPADLRVRQWPEVRRG